MRTLKITLLLLVLVTLSFAWNDLGGGICDCGTTCGDCDSALDSGTCSVEVKLTTDLTSTNDCIQGFSNKIFDCQGHSITMTVGNNNYRGIILSSNTGNTIKNCRITNFESAIALYSNSNNNDLINNTLYSNRWGIYLQLSDNNDIINNTGKNNEMACYLWTASNNDFINNTAKNNSWQGFRLIYQSSYNTLINNVAYDGGDGFWIYDGSNNNSIINNTVYDNRNDGFLISTSSDNNLTNNTVYNNKNGFYLQSSSNNNLINNTAKDNNEHGFYISTGSKNNLTNNTAKDNNEHGFYIYRSNYNNLTNNRAHNNSKYGFHLLSTSAQYTNLSHNNASNNMDGFYILTSDYNNLTNNTANNNDKHGFVIAYSTGNNLTNNTAKENGQSDIFVEANSDTYCDNIIADMVGSGGRQIYYANSIVNWNGLVASQMFLCGADNSVIENSVIHGSDDIQNNEFSMHLTNNTLVSNVVSYSNAAGFDIRNMPNNSNTFINITAYNNQQGILLSWFPDNTTYMEFIGPRVYNNSYDLYMNSLTATLYSKDTDRINASDYGQIDYFGDSVSIDGDYAIVGARYWDASGSTNEGAAYIFKRVGETWTEMQRINASDYGQSDYFGDSVSISGDYAIVGAFGWDAPDTSSSEGAAYIFKRVGETWTEMQRINASDYGQSDYFGDSVSISGDYAIVGARYWDASGSTNEGAAYIFKRVGETWTEMQRINASDYSSYDYFGDSVSIDGDYAIVGATGWNAPSSYDEGVAYIFWYNGTGWEEQARINASDYVRYGSFGVSVSISGDYAVVGANATPAGNEGAAYIFKRDGTTWLEEAKLTAYDGEDYDGFGNSVSISGDYAVVGAEWWDAPGTTTNDGAVYLFQRAGTIWTGQAKLLAGDYDSHDYFGSSVSISGDYIIAGAFGWDAPGNDGAGAAYIISPEFEGGIANITNALFLNPSGTFENYTNLSVYDALAGEQYSISWATNNSALPASSFEQKFVDISVQGGTPNITGLVWHWTDAEAGAYTEDDFGVWKYNGSDWADANAALDTGANTLSLNDADNFSIFGILAGAAGGAPEGGKGEEPEGKLSVDVSLDCDMNVVTVTDGGEPVEGVDVQVINTGIISGTTDANGEFSFEGCGHSAVIYVNKDGYPPKSISEELIDCAVCEAGCEVDDDCPDSMECTGDVCVPVDCDCGTVVNHQCLEYVCCADTDCPEGNVCENHECVSMYECTSDSDCDSSEYCENNECNPVTGECGYVQGHVWVQYECGDEAGCPDCPQGEVCLDNRCEAGDIDCPAVSYVEEEGACTARIGGDICANCDYRVIDPAKEWYKGKTDENGSIPMPFDLEGEYKVALIKDGMLINEVIVNVVPKAPPEEAEKPVEEAAEDALSWLWLIVVLAVLVVAFLYWRQKKGVKPKKK